MTRRKLLLVAALGAYGSPQPFPAQEPASQSATGRRIPRRAIVGALGAVTGGAVSLLFSDGASSLAIGVAGGGLAGFLIGREIDDMHAFRYRAGAQLRIPFEEASLGASPVAIAARDGRVAVATNDGVLLFRSDDSALVAVGQRANGIRGISALDIAPRSGELALASPTGLYVFPPTRGPGILIRDGAISSAAAAETRIFFGVGRRIEVAPLDADSTREWPGTELASPVRDLEWDSGRSLLWAVTDGELLAFRSTGDSLERIGALPIGAGALRISADGSLAAIAFGGDGIRLYDVTRAEQPVETAHWSAARFSYDVALDGNVLYVGSGPEGMYTVDVSGPAPRTIGLGRDLGFAATILSRDRFTYILDRRTNTLRRITSTVRR